MPAHGAGLRGPDSPVVAEEVRLNRMGEWKRVFRTRTMREPKPPGKASALTICIWFWASKPVRSSSARYWKTLGIKLGVFVGAGMMKGKRVPGLRISAYGSDVAVE